jgi:DNA-binding GntR family transcriptional regulator
MNRMTLHDPVTPGRASPALLAGGGHDEAAKRPIPGYSRVAAGIRAMIIAGEVAPGSWLRLQALADRFGVSMQPVREALQLLQGEGLVELHPNRGAQVRGLDRSRLIHIYEIRAGLESIMARRFAEEASGREIRTLERIQVEHDAALDTGEIAGIQRVNKVFHAHINGRGGNEEVLALMGRYYGLSLSVRERSGYSAAHWRRVRAEHHGLLDAFRRHDGPTAGDIGARHVLAGLEDVLAWLDAGAPDSTEHPQSR